MIHNNNDYKSIMKGERVSVLQHIIRHRVLCMTFFFNLKQEWLTSWLKL